MRVPEVNPSSICLSPDIIGRLRGEVVAMGLQLQVNVAQLLKDRVGATKTVALEDSALELGGDAWASVHGELRLTRVDQGVWASGPVAISMDSVCSRCLVPFVTWLDVRVEDVFLPSVDIVTGAKLRYEAGDDDADIHSIDGQHVLDLNDALRQYRLAAVPLAPICREECKGICPECGNNRNDSGCSCERYQDARWAQLRELLS